MCQRGFARFMLSRTAEYTVATVVCVVAARVPPNTYFSTSPTRGIEAASAMLGQILLVTFTNCFHQSSWIFRSQSLNCPFSSVSKPMFATKYVLESAWRDLLGVCLQLPHASRALSFQNVRNFLAFSSKSLKIASTLTNHSSKLTNNSPVRHFGMTNCYSLPP